MAYIPPTKQTETYQPALCNTGPVAVGFHNYVQMSLHAYDTQHSQFLWLMWTLI